jgi:ribose transport system permease protein
MSTIAPALEEQKRRNPLSILTRPGVGLLAFLVVVSIVAGLLEPSFFGAQNWANIGNQMVFVTILGVSMTLVLIGGGIDLSVGAIVGLSGAVVAQLLIAGVPLGVALVVGILTGLGIGIGNGLIITKLGIPDFIATLATLAVVRGILQAWTVGVPFLINFSNSYAKVSGLTEVVGRVTVPMLVAVAVALVVFFLLRYTIIGQRIRAMGSNREATGLAGVRVNRVKILLYAISGTLAGVTGVLLAGRLGTVQPTMGAGLEVSAIAAAVMGGAALTGGKGSVFGAVVGALTLTIIQNIINLFNVSPAWETFVVGAVILLAVLVDRGTSGRTRKAL